MTTPHPPLQGVSVALGILVLLLSSGRPAISAAPGAASMRTFAEARRELTRRGLSYVLEEPAFKERAPFDAGGASANGTLARFAEAFDYRWENDGEIVRLHKRYSDLDDRPSFSAEELSAAVDQLLPLIEPLDVPWREGIAPSTRFKRSFTAEQLDALLGHPTLVTALPSAQRKLLNEWGTGEYFLGHAVSRLRLLRDVLQSLNSVRFVWGRPGPAVSRELLLYYYDTPGQGNAVSFAQLPSPGFDPRRQNSGFLKENPAMPELPVAPSSRRLPFKVTIDRPDVTVADIFEDIRAQVSVLVAAPSYFLARRVSVSVREVEVGKLLDAMGAVFGWQWDASSAGRVRVARPSFAPPTWARMRATVWSMLPKPMRAYLAPAPERPSMMIRRQSAVLLTNRKLYDSIREKLAAPQGVRWSELTPERRQRFLDHLAYDFLGTAFSGERLAPPWLAYPEKTYIMVSGGAPAGRAKGNGAGPPPPKILGRSGLLMRLAGPSEDGGRTEIGFSLDDHPAVSGVH